MFDLYSEEPIKWCLKDEGSQTTYEIIFKTIFLRYIQSVPDDLESVMNVAKEMFKDGKCNWGRVISLFYFAYKMCLKV